MKSIYKILLWIISVLCLIVAIVFIPSISSLLFVFAAVLLVPVDCIQKIIKKLLPPKWMRIVIIVLVLVAGIIISIDTIQDNDTTKVNENTNADDYVTTETTSTTNSLDETIEENSIVINTKSLKMHFSSCTFGKKISEENKLISNASAEDLIAEGYLPCSYCMSDLISTESSESSSVSESISQTGSSAESDDLGTSEVDSNIETDKKTYVLNISSGKFHFESCHTIKKLKEENKKICESTYEDMIEQGYSPCGVCKPH